jgi:hypothetical protein
MGRHAKVKQIDRATCRKLRTELEKVLEPFGKKFGISVTTGSGRFSDNNFTLKIEMATVDKDGNVRNKEAEAFKLMASVYGLKPEHLNTSFKTWTGESFEIVGWATRSKKYPILAKNKEGKTFKFPVEEVKTLLKA